VTIQSGQNLLHYRLTDKLGAGGMGVVWKGVDTTLDREVAVKILPEAFAQDVERLARFEREAKLLASLNHPNIAVIYGFHESKGQRFLAMELVPGEELAARVKRGPLPVEEALESCRQIALALDAAHENGVIHRDLKPANVKLTPDDKIKVLDFGLAKAFETGSADSSLSQSPTMTSAGTRAGMILGTAAYMSPEQARGKVVDKRTDVWAFGCVLYECLTGKQAFGGDTVSDVLASILKSEPDWPALTSRVSPRTVRLLKRCLEKDPAKRLRDIGEASIEIDELLAGDPTASAGDDVGGRPASWLRVAVAGVVGAVAGALLWGALGSRAGIDETPQGPSRLDIALSEDLSIGSIRVSPDERSILLQTDKGYYLRRLDEYETRLIPDTERCSGALFSPDGRSIVLFRYTDQILGRGKLQRVSLEDRPTITLYESTTPTEPVVWLGDTIWVAYDYGKKLGRMPTSGGEPEVVVDVSSNDEERGLALRQVLPGVRHGLLAVGTDSGVRTELVSLDSGERELVHDGFWSSYVPSGHLLESRDGTLMALPFDLESRAPTGPAVPILSDVQAFEVSPSGTLFYVQATGSGTDGQLILSNREGVMEPASEKMPIWFVRYSPDGTRLSTVGGSLTLHGLSDKMTRPLESGDIQVSDHEWMPDGKAITYTGFTAGKGAIYRHEVDGGTPPTVLLESEKEEDIFPTDWSPDGAVMVYSRYADDDSDLWLLPADGSEPVPLLATESSDDLGRFSPDGRWLAYESNESGQQEIYVRSYLPEARTVGPKWRISNEGGTDPQWSPNGTELYYESDDGKLVAVQIRGTAGALAVGERSVLFDFRELGVLTGSDQSYDVAPDGEHFVFVRHDISKTSNIRVVLDWFEELERLAPPNR